MALYIDNKIAPSAEAWRKHIAARNAARPRVMSSTAHNFLVNGQRPTSHRERSALLDEMKSLISSEITAWTPPTDPASLDRLEKASKAAKEQGEKAMEATEQAIAEQRKKLHAAMAKNRTASTPANHAGSEAPPSTRAALVSKHEQLVKERQRLGLATHSGELSERESRLLRTLHQLPRYVPPAERTPGVSEETDSRLYQKFEKSMIEILPTINQLTKSEQ